MKPRTLGVISGLVVLSAMLWLNWPCEFARHRGFPVICWGPRPSSSGLVLNAAYGVFVVLGAYWGTWQAASEHKLNITIKELVSLAAAFCIGCILLHVNILMDIAADPYVQSGDFYATIKTSFDARYDGVCQTVVLAAGIPMCFLLVHHLSQLLHRGK